MRGRTRTGGRITQLAGLRFSKCNELADILREEIGLGDMAHEIADVLREDLAKPDGSLPA